MGTSNASRVRSESPQWPESSSKQPNSRFSHFRYIEAKALLRELVRLEELYQRPDCPADAGCGCCRLVLEALCDWIDCRHMDCNEKTPLVGAPKVA